MSGFSLGNVVGRGYMAHIGVCATVVERSFRIGTSTIKMGGTLSAAHNPAKAKMEDSSRSHTRLNLPITPIYTIIYISTITST